MAEFCPSCWNRINKTTGTEKRYILSRGLERCEECGEYRHVIVRERRFWRLATLFTLFQKPGLPK